MAATDSLAAGPDSLGVTDSLAAGLDSLAVTDSAAVSPDTTDIGFVIALRNVKIYRKNMQVVCDSLLYCDLDSLARLFKEPVIWNEITQQYNADSISVVVRNNAMEKASLMSNAFIHIEEDTTHYNQIKGAEMMAYFSEEGELSRFDALGGASALFYIEENDALATVNKKDSKMLSAIFRDGELNRIYYFDTAVSDAFPVVQMTEEDRKLKGFNWQPDRRPADRHAVTSLDLRPSERTSYNARPRARYVETDLYFPGYIDDIYLQIALRDSLNHVRSVERQREEEMAELRRQQVEDSLAIAKLDSLEAVKADSLARQDSLKAVSDSLAVADSIAKADSIAALQDNPVVLTKEQMREQKKVERERKKKERIAARDARWAAKDEADARKEQSKLDRKAEKAREKEIDFSAFIDFEGIDFIEPLDISTIFGNGIDNAMEACEKLPREERVITVKAGKVRDFVSILIENNCSDEVHTDGNTTKSDKFLHGFGISNMKKAAEKYGGTCTTTQEDGKFILKILLPVP